MEKGIVLTNPDDSSQTYTIGQRGRRPVWVRTLLGEGEPPRPKSRFSLMSNPRQDNTKVLSGCSVEINGASYCYVSNDASIIVNGNDDIRLLSSLEEISVIQK